MNPCKLCFDIQCFDKLNNLPLEKLNNINLYLT